MLSIPIFGGVLMDRYLDLLSEKFPTTEDVITEIINLEAILQLPKGTELFLSDIPADPSFDRSFTVYDSQIHSIKSSKRIAERI